MAQRQKVAWILAKKSGQGGSKILKIMQTSFMYDPLWEEFQTKCATLLTERLQCRFVFTGSSGQFVTQGAIHMGRPQNFLDFLPPPPCPHLVMKYSTKSAQHPLLCQCGRDTLYVRVSSSNRMACELKVLLENFPTILCGVLTVAMFG